MEGSIPEFSTLVKNRVLDGDKVRIDDLLNKDIVVCGFQVSKSKYNDKGSGVCVKVQFYCADDETETRKIFFSGSSVIQEQLEEAKESLDKNEQPLLFKSKVRKIGNYYTLV